MPVKFHMLQDLRLKKKEEEEEEGEEEEEKICGLEESNKDWEAMYSSSHQGICRLDPPALDLMS